MQVLEVVLLVLCSCVGVLPANENETTLNSAEKKIGNIYNEDENKNGPFTKLLKFKIKISMIM